MTTCPCPYPHPPSPSAADRLEVALLAPELKFVNRSMSVDQPFKPQRGRGLRLKDTAAEFGAHWHQGALDRVEHERHFAFTREGEDLAFPIEQGGLAAQQADAVAEAIAASAGAEIDPQPFPPVQRGLLLTGRAPRIACAAAYVRAQIGARLSRADPCGDLQTRSADAISTPPLKPGRRCRRRHAPGGGCDSRRDHARSIALEAHPSFRELTDLLRR